MITAGLKTTGTTHTALNNHTDRLVTITTDMTPVVGNLADTSHHWLPAFRKLNGLSDKFLTEVWRPERDVGNMRMNLSLTPTYTYTRADCPQYGELKGPSCYTAPLVVTRPAMPDVLLPQNYQPPKDLAPPPGTVVGENGNLVAVGPPLINPNPSLADPNPPLPPGMLPAPPVPGTANSALPLLPQAPFQSPLAPVAPKPGSPAPAPAPVRPRARPGHAGGRRGRARIVRRQRRSGRQPAGTCDAQCHHRSTRQHGNAIAAGPGGPRHDGVVHRGEEPR